MTSPNHLSHLDLPEEALREAQIAQKEWHNWREQGVTPCFDRTKALIHVLFQKEQTAGADSVGTEDGTGMEDAAMSDAA